MIPSNFPDICRAAGLQVVELDGWRGRARAGSFAPVGTLVHHTGSYDGLADAPNDLAYAYWLAEKGRTDLGAPLCQFALSAEGVVYFCASGRSNHAGKAKASGPVPAGDGNTLYYGIEAMNSGSQGWSKEQYDAYEILCALISIYVTHKDAEWTRAHKETSITGKIDPSGPTPFGPTFDMGRFREGVAWHINRLNGAPGLVPSPEVSRPSPVPVPPRLPPVQNRDPLTVDGDLGPKTIRRWQEILGTPADGEISTPKSSLVWRVQEILNAAGARDRDGNRLRLDGAGIGSNTLRTYGPTRTVAALQRYLGTGIDGKLDRGDSSAVRELQRRLNNGRF